MSKISNNKCVIGVDIDFTIARFERSLGALNQARIVASVTGGNPEQIQMELEAISLQLIAKNRASIGVIERVFDLHVHPVGLKLEERLWSTAARFLVYIEEVGHDPTKYYHKAVEAEAAFWDGVGKMSGLYDDAQEFRETLRRFRLPVFALTSSDARTHLCAEGRRIQYEFNHSIDLKYKRLQPSGIFDLIPREDIVVSDPWPKEDLRVWELRVFPRFPERPDRAEWIFVGDTVYDMHAALVAGVGTRIYLERHAHTKRPAEATHCVQSLTEAGALIEELLT